MKTVLRVIAWFVGIYALLIGLGRAIPDAGDVPLLIVAVLGILFLAVRWLAGHGQRGRGSGADPGKFNPTQVAGREYWTP